MLESTNFRILHILEQGQLIFSMNFLDFFQETSLIDFNLIQYFINIFLNSDKVGFDSLLLEESDVGLGSLELLSGYD